MGAAVLFCGPPQSVNHWICTNMERVSISSFLTDIGKVRGQTPFFKSKYDTLIGLV